MAHISVENFNEKSTKTIDFFLDEFKGLQTGIASPALVENVQVDSYGTLQPLKAIASISVEGGQTLLISPWDKGLLGNIEKAIIDDNSINLAPMNDGVGVRLNIPPLTKERRAELSKVASKKGEDAKVSIRKHRHDAMEMIKNDEDLSEDMKSSAEKELQKAVDNANKTIDSHVKAKQESMMKL